ncbi:MAG TPA: cytidine deaminase [Thermomicrobiales bacterium]|jgi:cytidine deaminase|nr:cytidine deaminase [Thermomicrobiales bacterium]
MNNQETGTGAIAGDVVERMLATARSFAQRAYVPYSQFPVGAAVLTADGEIIGGVNIENASYGLTVCGERVAIFTAAAAGHREIRAVAVSAPKAAGTTPCGACRQVMNEFKPFDNDLIVFLDDGERVRQVPLGELLPESFGPRDLERATDR